MKRRMYRSGPIAQSRSTYPEEKISSSRDGGQLPSALISANSD